MSDGVGTDEKLLMLIDGVEQAREGLVKEREALSLEREVLAVERGKFREASEQERSKLSQLRGEVLQVLRDEVQKAAKGSTETVLQATNQKIEAYERSLFTKLEGRQEAFVKAVDDSAKRVEEVGKKAGSTLASFSKKWREALYRSILVWGPGAILSLLVLLFVNCSVVRWSSEEMQNAREEAAHYRELTDGLKPEYDKMWEEMKAWKAAGIEKVNLFPCPGDATKLCIRVEKKQAYGKEKDWFVPIEGAPTY